MLHSRGWIEIEWSTKTEWLRQYSIVKTYIGPQGPKFGALTEAPRFIPGLEIKKDVLMNHCFLYSTKLTDFANFEPSFVHAPGLLHS